MTSVLTVDSCRDSLPVCLDNENPNRLVSLWDIMRLFEPDATFRLCRELGQLSRDPGDQFGNTLLTTKRECEQKLIDLRKQCDAADLNVSTVEIRRHIELMSDPTRQITSADLKIMMIVLTTHIEDECSTKLFFAIEASHKKYFETPEKGWEQAIERFSDLVDDVYEMGKCYALGRNAAAVFHATQALETGAIHLGKFLRAKDPKIGFVATVNELKRIVKKDPKDRTEFQRQHFAFIEQMEAATVSLQNSWRHKIGHVAGRLILMTADFSDDVAEEILVGSRAFMRRLATEIPLCNDDANEAAP
jgi:hypothetical protein